MASLSWPSALHKVDSHSVSVFFAPEQCQGWWLTCVYGPQGNDNKIQFLEELREIRAAYQGPWILDILISYIGRTIITTFWTAMMGRFRRLINDLVLKELPLHGRKFTWSNRQDSPSLVKFDCVFCPVDWEELYPNCLLQSRATEDSDHCPLILGLNDIKANRRRFHFESFCHSWRAFRKWLRQHGSQFSPAPVLLTLWQENCKQPVGACRVGARRKLATSIPILLLLRKFSISKKLFKMAEYCPAVRSGSCNSSKDMLWPFPH